MAITIQLMQNRLPLFNFKLPFPQTTIDYLEFTYVPLRSGNSLLLTVNVVYQLEDFDTKERYEVTRFWSIYAIKPENELLTAAKLYPVCEGAADMLRSRLGLLVESREIPPRNLSCPPVCHLLADLQKVVEWYNSH
jgi:hypothetical protein